MNQYTAFITGANGAIGQALCAAFHDAGHRVVASDQAETAGCPVDAYVPMECSRLCNDSAYHDEIINRLRAELGDGSLHVLINNAAIQIVAPVEKLSVDDWHTSMDVNLVAPFLLIRALLAELTKAKGSVINIASIHAQLTKPHFTAYATSKAALVGMTRSLAVELGNRVRVNAICPAAIATPMLEAGFDDKLQGLDQLASYHPTGTLGTTRDIAEAALYLAKVDGLFLNGAVINLDGGISSRLHDPA
ncbi:glucose 1-dehydrogenase 4 [bacterium BMS3Abin11]|nr:glucose 1-dehydrogenase 4 [bacterium BMS3Abin11]HDH08858.1 SDR family oxidoreductase [Gammaproteobacteria bacterium]